MVKYLKHKQTLATRLADAGVDPVLVTEARTLVNGYIQQRQTNSRMHKDNMELRTSIERLRVALLDVTNALEPFVETDAKTRKPYEHPLSAYDRAREELKGGTT